MKTALVGAAALVAVATGASSQAAAKASAPVVVLTIHNSRFSVRSVTVPAGRVVRFVVHNTDPIDHELIIGPDDVQLRHEHGAEPRHGDRPGEVSVPAETTAETTYLLAPGTTVPFGCHFPDHWDYGMHGTVKTELVWIQHTRARELPTSSGELLQ